MGQKTLFSKKSKRGYKRLFFYKFFLYAFRQTSIERIQTSLIHLPPYTQEIIDKENQNFGVFLKMPW